MLYGYGYGLSIPGLGDCATDVRTQMASDYVHAGSILEYQATVGRTVLGMFSEYAAKVRNAVLAKGYRAVAVEGPSPGLWTAGNGSLTVRVTAPGDQAGKNDVRANIDGAVMEAGLRVFSSRIAFLSRPSINDICSGQARDRAVETNEPPPPPDASCDIFCQAGKIFTSDTSKYLAIAGIGLVAWLVIGRLR